MRIFLRYNLIQFVFLALFSIAEYNVAVFVTNQMTADPGATMTYDTLTVKFLLSWLHIWLRI